MYVVQITLRTGSTQRDPYTPCPFTGQSSEFQRAAIAFCQGHRSLAFFSLPEISVAPLSVLRSFREAEGLLGLCTIPPQSQAGECLAAQQLKLCSAQSRRGWWGPFEAKWLQWSLQLPVTNHGSGLDKCGSVA